MQDCYSQLIFDENKTQIFVETKNVCSCQNYLFERYNLIGDNKIFAEEFPITCDHQRLTSLLIDSSLVADPLNKITFFDIRSSPIHSPITSFHDPTLYLKPILPIVNVTNASYLILQIDSPKIYFPPMDFMMVDHTLHSKFYDRIAEWLENSYLKIFLETGKFVLSVYVNKISKGKNNIFLPIFLLVSYHLWLLFGNHVILVDFEVLQWLNWLFHFT